MDNDGKATGVGADAWGYGFYPGQYGMVLLSRYPIDVNNIRTFQHFKWHDMPHYLPTVKADGSPWYSNEAWQQFPLSSKSHWDIPVNVNNKLIHILASHPTPPVFDGPENRNGKRNHDEIRFWADYLTPENAGYIYDDKGHFGGLAPDRAFVVLGDLNSSPHEGDSIKAAIAQLLSHPAIESSKLAQSKGGSAYSPDNPYATYHTTLWRMQVDYVLSSKSGLQILESGVFWPLPYESGYELVIKRQTSSDHRLVWLNVQLETRGSDSGAHK